VQIFQYANVQMNFQKLYQKQLAHLHINAFAYYRGQ